MTPSPLPSVHDRCLYLLSSQSHFRASAIVTFRRHYVFGFAARVCERASWKLVNKCTILMQPGTHINWIDLEVNRSKIRSCPKNMIRDGGVHINGSPDSSALFVSLFLMLLPFVFGRPPTWPVFYIPELFSARCVHRTNHRAIARIFVRPSVWDGRALWSYGALKSKFKFTVV